MADGEEIYFTSEGCGILIAKSNIGGFTAIGHPVGNRDMGPFTPQKNKRIIIDC